MLLDPLAQLDLVAIVSVVAIFLATLLVLRRVFFGPLIEVMERRARRIEAAHAGRAEAEGVLQGARLRAEGLLATARDEAAREVDAARERAGRAAAARRAEAAREAEALLAAGRDEVEALRRAEEARLADELVACVSQALGRMVGRVEEAPVRLLVRRALAAREGG